MKILVSAVLLSAFFISCTKNGSLGGGSAQSGAFNNSVTGSVNGGLSPVIGALVSLFVAGNNAALATATTSSTGAFTLSYTNPGSGALYLLVTGGSAGSGTTNSKLQLAALLGAANNAPTSVVVNEISTTGFFNAAFNYGMVSDTNGTVTFNAANNQAAMTSMIKQYGNFVTNGSLNGSLSSTNQSIFGTTSNGIAICVEVPGNCATLFNNAATSSSAASVSILDAIFNMLNGTSSITNIFSSASSVASSTGIAIPSQPTLLNVAPIVAPSTIAAGNGPFGIGIDSNGNFWVVEQSGNNISELSSSGSILGTFSVGNNPLGDAIDANNNIWVANCNDNNVRELNSTGSLLGTFSVGTCPANIAIDSSGNIWVTNFSSGTISKLNASGSLIQTISIGTNLEGIAIDQSGNAWANIYGNGTVRRFNSSGSPNGTFSVGGSGGVGIAIAPNGNVWVTTGGGGTTLNELSPAGTVLGSFSATASRGVTITSNGYVLVSSSNGNLIYLFDAQGNRLNTYPVGTRPFSIVVDSNGNVWVGNNGGTTLTEFPGLTVGPEFFPFSGPAFPGSSD